MGLLLFLILLAVSGLILGAIGRLALPGPDPMGIGTTILVGLGGSFLGGIVGRIVFGTGGGFVLAALGATFIVWLIRRSRGGSITDPGLGRPRLGRRH
jgi:uncharacterized membrane protein YeaQ/YmgE (transglycosylase-associated protein family)